MMNVESIDLADETPEVDAAKQRLAVAVEDESGLDTTTSTRLKPVVVFVHVLNADGNLIWAEIAEPYGVPRIRLLRVQLAQTDFRRRSGNNSSELRGERTNARGPRFAARRSTLHAHRGIGCGGTVVRLAEKHVPGGGIYWNGPRVAEIYSGLVYGGLRLSVPVRRRHAEGIWQFPECAP